MTRSKPLSRRDLWHPTTDGLLHVEHSMAKVVWPDDAPVFWSACGVTVRKAAASLDHAPHPKCEACEKRQGKETRR